MQGDRSAASRRPPKGMIEVEVAWAEPSRQVSRSVSVPSGTTLREAVRAAGLEAEIAELRGETLDLGVFGRRLDPDTEAQPGDRVEIYRPLQADPKELRRIRARMQRERRGGSRR